MPNSYGTLVSTLFAAKHSSLVHSTLFLAPLPPSLYYASAQSLSYLESIAESFSFGFAQVLPAYLTELGLHRLVNTVQTGSSRESRVESTEDASIRGEVMRSWLEEEKERRVTGSRSAKSWDIVKGKYPSRPSIVLSSSLVVGNSTTGTGKRLKRREERRFGDKEFARAEDEFVQQIVGKALVRWDRNWSGDCGSGQGLCQKALKELVDS